MKKKERSVADDLNRVAVEIFDTSAKSVQQVVQIDPLLLKDEFAKLPGQLAHYNELFAQALRKYLRAERRRKETFARLYLEKRESAEEKLSEGMIKAMVESDEEYEQACLHEIDTEVDKAKLWGICEAIRAKKDALISIGAHVRAELGGDPFLRDRARGMRDVDATRDEG